MAERGREAGPNPKRSLKSVLRQLFFDRPPTPTPEPARKARNRLPQKTKPAQNYQSIQEYRQDAGLDGSQVAAPVVRSSEAYTQPRRARENTLDDLFDERPNYISRKPLPFDGRTMASPRAFSAFGLPVEELNSIVEPFESLSLNLGRVGAAGAPKKIGVSRPHEKRVPKVPGPESEKPRKIIVGIDFGTTFSGVA